MFTTINNTTDKYFVICTERTLNGESRTVYMNRDLGAVHWLDNIQEAERFPSETAARKFPSEELLDTAGYQADGMIARTFRIAKVNLSLTDCIDK